MCAGRLKNSQDRRARLPYQINSCLWRCRVLSPTECPLPAISQDPPPASILSLPRPPPLPDPPSALQGWVAWVLSWESGTAIGPDKAN